MRTEQVLIGLLAGVAIGALTGVLLAPEKGTKTRKNLINQGEDIANDLKDKFDELMEKLTGNYERIHQQASLFAKKEKAKYAEAKKELNHTA